MKRILRILHLLVFAWMTLASRATHVAHAAEAADEVVNMETFTVSAAKHQWRRAQSPHFEILSSVDDVKLVTQIIQRSTQIIETFQKNCPLFRPKNNRPVRLIFINDRGIERFLTLTGNDALQTARDRPPIGVEESNPRKGRVRQISARGYYDDEQIILLKIIPQKYLESTTPFDERVRENALDLAINYLLVCADTHIQPGTAPWLAATLNSLRGHGAGATWKLPDNFESATYGTAGNTYARPAWFTLTDNHMSVGRYCLACESKAYRNTGDFPHGENEESIAAQKKTWSNFLPSPRTGLRAALEETTALSKSKKNTTALVNHELGKQRESLDFVYYCVFNTDPKIRTAFANFAASLSKQTPNEKTFTRCFGKNYEAFHENIYAFYRSLKQSGDGAAYKNNPWGPPAIVVAQYTNKDIPKPVVFRNAKRNETTLMVSDWFTLCKAGELARQTLIKADKESPQAHADPEIAAALALAEASPDAKGDKLKAMAMLEAIASAPPEKRTTRPRVYCTLSRLLLEEIFEIKGNTYRLAANDVRNIITPLVTALKMPEPPLQVYVQFAALWKHTDIKPPKEYLDAIAAACRQFPNEMELLQEAIPLLTTNGLAPTARQIAEEATQSILSETDLRQLEDLKNL